MLAFTATATDAAGNTAHKDTTATKDVVAPAVSLTTVTDPIDSTNEHAVTASGTGEVGATISLVASDGPHSTTALTTTVDAGGTWSISQHRRERPE